MLIRKSLDYCSYSLEITTNLNEVQDYACQHILIWLLN